MNYTLHQLQIFSKVAELQSITKAAEALHLTQPAVSIQVKNFQDQFEIPLIEVIGRKVHITSFGQEIALSCRQILEEVGQIETKKMSYLGFLSGKLDIAVVSTGKYVMPYFLSRFVRQHPGIQLNMDVTNKEKVIKSLAANEVDFALVSVLPENMSIDFTPLMKNKLYLVSSSRDEQFMSVKKARDLEKLPLIFREKGSATRQAMESFISSTKLNVSKKLELTSNEAVKQAVLSGLGLSIMPIIGIRNELLNGELVIIPLNKLPIVTTWNLVWLKDKAFSPVADAYLEFLEKEKQQIIEDSFSWYNQF